MKKLLPIFALLSTPAHSFIFAEPGVGLAFSKSSFNVDEPNRAFEHRGLGANAELLGRAGIGFGTLRLGVVGSVAKESLRHKVKRTSPRYGHLEHDGTYSNSFNRTLFGPMLGLVADEQRVRLLFEYYTFARKEVSYTDSDTDSPFRDGDRLQGRGFGIGGGFYHQLFAGTLMFRSLRFRDYHFENYETRTSLHDDTRSSVSAYEISFQISFPLDVLMKGKAKKK